MAGATDHKRFIDRAQNNAFSRRFEAWIDKGVIPPFAILFPETKKGFIVDEGKPQKDLVQFGFVICDEDDRILVTSRAAFAENKRAAHTVTLGDSVLIGWSPVDLPDGRRFPASEQDIQYTFHQEVPELPGCPVKCTFLGLVRNEIQRKLAGVECVLRYYFYLFEMRYSGSPDFSRVRFLKDKDDLPRAFCPINEGLAEAVQDKKADLRALETVTRMDFSRFDRGGSILLRPPPGSLPPFLVHPPGVFLSHATPDDGIVDLIAQRLEQAGVSVWCDHRTLLPGQSWPWEISDAIKYGPCFVVLCSKASWNSPGVKDEVSKAIARKEHEKGYLVIPVVLEGESILEYVFSAIRDSLWVADLRNAAGRQAGIGDLVARVHKQVEQYGCLGASD